MKGNSKTGNSFNISIESNQSGSKPPNEQSPRDGKTKTFVKATRTTCGSNSPRMQFLGSRSSLSSKSSELRPKSVQPDFNPNLPPEQLNKESSNSKSFTSSQKQNPTIKSVDKFKYNSETPGKLITSGNIIFQQIRKFKNDEIASNETESVEQFFAKIDGRTMTEANKDHYRRLVEEYVQTEATHIKGLVIFLHVYLKPMAQTNKVDRMLVNDVSSQVETLISVHNNIKNVFENGLKDLKESDLPVFGQEFVYALQSLKIASQYISNYDDFSKKLVEYTTIPAVEKKIKKAKTELVNSMKNEKGYENFTEDSIQNITSYAITPIQRIPRYALLIRDMLKDVGEDFPGLELLKRAYIEARDCANGVNQSKMLKEESEKVCFIKTLFTRKFETEDQMSRRFICCGGMYSVQNTKLPPDSLYYTFLFNDLIVFTTPVSFKGELIAEDKIKEEFNKIKQFTKLDELSNYQFLIEKEIHFKDDDCFFIPIEDTQNVPFLCCLNISKQQGVGVNDVTRSISKYSFYSQEEKDAWMSIMNDQFKAISLIRRNKENILSNKNAISTNDINKNKQNHRRSLSFQRNSVNQEEFLKLHKKEVVLGTVAGTSNSFSIKYVSDIPGELIQCGDVISKIKPQVIDKFTNNINSNDLLFKFISMRELLNRDREQYHEKWNELTILVEKELIPTYEMLQVVFAFSISKAHKSHNLINDFIDCINSTYEQLNSLLNGMTSVNEFLQQVTHGKDSKVELPKISETLNNNSRVFDSIKNLCLIFKDYYDEIEKIFTSDRNCVKAFSKNKQEYVKKSNEEWKMEGIREPLLKPLKLIIEFYEKMKDIMKCLGKDCSDIESMKKAYLHIYDCYVEAKRIINRFNSDDVNKFIDSILIDESENKRSKDKRDSDTIIDKGKFILCGPAYYIQHMHEEPTVLVYNFLFENALIQTEVRDKKRDYTIEELVRISDYHDLVKYKFLITQKYVVNERCEIMKLSDSSTVRNVMMVKVFKTDGSMVITKFAFSADDEREVWKSAIFDIICSQGDIIVKTKEKQEKKAEFDKRQLINSSNISEAVEQVTENDASYHSKIIEQSYPVKKMKDILKNDNNNKSSTEVQCDFINRLEEKEIQLTEDQIKEKQNRLMELLNEIIEKEKGYVYIVSGLYDVFFQPISLNYNDGAIIEKLTDQVKVIQTTHSSVLKICEEIVKKASTDNKAPIITNDLIRAISSFSNDVSYISSISKVKNELLDVAKRTQTLNLIERAKQTYMLKNKGQIEIPDLQDSLYKPYEMVTFFKGILKEMLECTSGWYNCYTELKRCYLIVSDNEKKLKKFENNSKEEKKLLLLKDVIQCDLISEIQETQKLICCGPFYSPVICRLEAPIETNINLLKEVTNVKEQWNGAYLFLFSETLLYTKLIEYKGEPIDRNTEKSEYTEIYNKLHEIENISDLNDYKFIVVKQIPFTQSVLKKSKLIKVKKNDSEEIAKVNFYVQTQEIIFKFTIENIDDIIVWKNLIYMFIESTNKANKEIII